MKAVLMCGGIGSKMWPESRQTKPKHFLPLLGEKSLFEITYKVLRKKFEAKDIYVQTNAVQADMARKLVPEIPIENVFVEPELRNHGPATGFMAAKLMNIAPDEVFMTVQTDVLRIPEDKFLEMIDEVERLIDEKKKLVTGGVKPEFAVMGVDYLIRSEERVGEVSGMGIYKMDKWLERDSKDKVEEFVKRGRAFLHANHYAWTPRLMLEAYKRIKPDWYKALVKMMESGFDDETVKREYGSMEKGGVEEVTRTELLEGFVVELPFEWIDFGTWESVAKYLDKQGKKEHENVLEIDSTGNFYRLPSGKFVASIGVSDVVLVETADAILLCKKDKSSMVGQVVDYLKEKKRKELL